MSEAPLLVLAGPTASGKSELAVRLALRRNAEIVGADSQQVYRHFDLGTAKPGPRALAAVPHHLISVVEPGAAFSAARYVELADAAIADIRKRGKSVIVVGGTGLYLRALLHGVVPAPGADAVVRGTLTEEGGRRGWPALHARLQAVDPETAARIAPTDPVRIIRALELYSLTGTPASALRAAHRFAERRYAHAFHVIAPPRELLYAAIEARTRQLFAAGWVEETRNLVKLGFRSAAPMRSVGYRQTLAVVEGGMTETEAEAEVVRDTRRYAKRQLTWFRRVEGARWHAAPHPEDI